MHKFTIGETVHFNARLPGRISVDGAYEVIRLLPPDGDDFQYRIKNLTEAYERVAKESQLEQSAVTA